MISKKPIFTLFALLVFAAAALPRCWAEELRVYNTPPAALDGLPQEALNAFGLKLLTESYDIRAKVAKPSGAGEADAAIVNSAEAKAVVNLYDDDAIIQRARLNYGLTKKTYVPNYTGPFEISNVAVSRTSATVLVASFDVRLPDRTSLQSGNVYSGDAMPRIMVMRWNEQSSMWKIFSHGDFDAPRSYLCGADKEFMPPKSAFKPEDVDLAGKLWDKVQASSLKGNPTTMQSRGFQYVFASGERKTAPGKVRARLKQREEITNIESIKSGDLMVMRFDSISPMEIDGQDVDHALHPRLVTFHLDDDGQWRMNAIAVFHVTAKLAADVQCVTP